MFQLIETSLISGHFVDISNTAFLDIFSCNEYNTTDVTDFAKKFFRAKESNVTITGRYETPRNRCKQEAK